MTEIMDGLSKDVEAEELDKLKAAFPQCFVEGRLDIDKLLSLCGQYIDDDFEKYEFKWKGKAECLKLAQKRSTATLRPCPEESVNFETTKNLYIEGDNLEVLKLLQASYYRQVKMIYIDPPYNTGHDFIYEDDFKDTLARYKEVTSQTTKSNPESMGRFHTNWLNMMYPRLRLAASLLRDDGVIFISIDDHEVHNLRKLCDEAFGEENFVGTIIWKNATDNNPTQIAIEHEYTMCYAKNKSATESIWKTKISAVKDLLVKIGDELKEKYNDLDAMQEAYSKWFREKKSQLWPLDRYKYIDFDGVYTGSQSVHNPGREGYRYDIMHPITGQACTQPLLGYRFPESTMAELISQDKILFGDDHNKIVELKVYAHEYEEKLSSLFELDGRIGSYDLKELFGEKPVFSNPKPVQLIARFASFITSDNDLILDFFSGSATTAHAIMTLNYTDRKQRRYICVQLPENLDIQLLAVDQKSKATIKSAIAFLDSLQKPHYLTEIGKERLRRAGQKIQAKLTNDSPTLDFDGEGKPEPDTGFKVFKLDGSNLETWDPSPITSDQLPLLEERLNRMTERVKPDRTDLDMVYEIMLKQGLPLTESVMPLDIEGFTVYSVREDSLLLVCLEKDLSTEAVKQMAALAPARIIFGQDCFPDMTAMSNAKLSLRDAGIDFKFV
ncbi:site-specific DNA-methyltransferase [Deltaproteobacteria bacterium Smac51]|nr:site-specific DNA-methyltransferase [Deltaproteobacteria bacterium Smac51]